MRNKSKMKTILIALGIVFAFLSISNYNIFNNQGENKVTMEIRGSYIESFIHIDGNWSETATTYAWCSGDGSWGNPYTIENVIINASGSPTGCGIFINNSKNDYFIIRYCTVYDGERILWSGAGIKLENVNNGTLIDNDCSNNGWSGILLIYNCNNNTILANIANNNREYGIGITLNSNDNTIIGNIANHNSQRGIWVRSSNNNIIFGNTVNDNGFGIYMWLSCSNNIISGNTINYNLGGIFFQDNCNDNIISNNTVNSNTWEGIYIYLNSFNNFISGNTINYNVEGIIIESNCDNNNITANHIQNSLTYGIDIRDTNCENNLIYQNLLIGTSGWHAHDDGVNNQWDNSVFGNYWDNHTSPDSDNDGIVDNPYIWISGIASNEDRFPLVVNPIHVGEKIHIDDDGINAPNWSRTAELNFWCDGSGTYSDPYTIEGVKINASGTGSGIYIENSKNEYFILNNCTVYNAGNGNEDAGIRLENTNKGTLINNNCSNNGYNGIILFNDCENNTISGNTVNNNNDRGMHVWDHCNNNIISGNTANENSYDGIWLRDHCENNTVSGNIANNNIERGITMSLYCINNIFTENTANNNNYYGILLSNYCTNNTISNNIANENNPGGIHLWNYCDDNIVMGNTVNDNNEFGIHLYRSSNNTVSGNTANDNVIDGIHLSSFCHENTITGNSANNNDNNGLYFGEDCDNNIITRNLIEQNQLYGIVIADSVCQDNLIFHNLLVGTIGSHASDSGTNNNWDNSVIGNYWDNHTSPDSDNDGIVDNPYTWVSGNADSEDRFPLAESPLHVGDKIHIDDDGVTAPNWSRTTELYFWCNGSGTASDPYIIDGLDIDAGGSGSGILIENSDVYFIIRNCDVYNSPYGVFPYYDAGIKLNNTNNGTLSNIYGFNNDFGIFIVGSYNEITGSNIYGNTQASGIVIEGNDNIVQGNYVENNYQGIYLRSYSEDNIISGNTAYNNVNYGFVIYSYSNNNNVSGNIADSNPSGGIYVYNANNNIISGNYVNNNGDYGICFWYNCVNNTLSGNVAINNDYGIYIRASNFNNISGNTANFNLNSGIYLYLNSNNNSISENTAYNNYYGIYLYTECDNNSISGNTANNNLYYGIYLYSECDNNTISGNTANYNWYNGIFLYNECDNNTISGNTATSNNLNGISLSDNCDKNTIIGNVICYNHQYGIVIDSLCIDNLIYLNNFKNEYNARDYGNNQWDNGTIGNYWDDYDGVDADDDGIGDTPYNISGTGGSQDNFPIWEDGIDIILLFVEIFDQIFSTEDFNITFYVYNGFNEGIDFATIQMWWNGIEVSTSIQNLGNGLYFVSLDPITVEPEEDPILLNMIISASGYEDKYFETYLAVEPHEIVKFLQVEVIENSYSLEHFNLTIFICDETELGIDSAAIQMWWNGVEVSMSIQNLGNGLYFVSLEPITVAPGEDPILLNMTISADGYEDKHFETHLAVDPDTLEKEGGKITEEFPLTIIVIAITSIAGGIVVVGVAIVLLRRRKGVSEN